MEQGDEEETDLEGRRRGGRGAAERVEAVGGDEIGTFARYCLIASALK